MSIFKFFSSAAQNDDALPFADLALVESQIFSLNSEMKISLNMRKIHENITLTSDASLLNMMRIEIFTKNGYNPLADNVLDISFDNANKVSEMTIIGNDAHIPKAGHGGQSSIIINGKNMTNTISGKEIVKVVISLPEICFQKLINICIENEIGIISISENIIASENFQFKNYGTGSMKTGNISTEKGIKISLIGSGDSRFCELSSHGNIILKQSASGALAASSIETTHEFSHVQNGSGDFTSGNIFSNSYCQDRTASGKFGCGNIVTKTFDVKVSGSGDLYAQKVHASLVSFWNSASCKISIQELKGEVLIVTTSGSGNFETHTLEFGKSVDFTNSQSCKTIVLKSLLAPKLTIVNSGSGNVEICHLASDYVDVKIGASGKFYVNSAIIGTSKFVINGSANCEVAGVAGFTEIIKTSSGAFKGEGLTVGIAELTMSGSADVTLKMNAHDCVVNKISGSGKIKFV